MDSYDMAEGYRVYKRQKRGSSLFFWEMIICSIAIGVYFQSLPIFFLSFVLLMFIARFSVFAWVLSIFLSLFWACIIFLFAFVTFHSLVVSLIISVLIFLTAFSAHRNGLRL